MANSTNSQLILKASQAVLYIGGAMLTTYNLFAFKLTKAGSIYFRDDNQLWLAIGIAMIAPPRLAGGFMTRPEKSSMFCA